MLSIKTMSIALVAAAATVTPAMAAGLLDAVPVRIQVGNGLPLTTGGSSSAVGISVLSKYRSVGSAAGIRVLGTEKTFGFRVTKPFPDGGTRQLGADFWTPIDPVVTRLTTPAGH